VIQVALSLPLLVAAVLLFASYQSLGEVDVGYPVERIVSVKAFYGDSAGRNRTLEKQAEEAIAGHLLGIPGVQGTARRGRVQTLLSATTLVRAEAFNEDDRIFANADTTRSISRHMYPPARHWVVSDDYFRLLELRVVAGRALGPEDRIGSLVSVVISQELSKYLGGPASAVGRSIQVGSRGEQLRVVGVVEDVYDVLSGRKGLSASAHPDLYLSERQANSADTEILVLMTTPDAHEVVAAEARRMTRSGPPPIIRELADAQDGSERAMRILTILFGFFGGSTLLLVLLGAYSVTAFSIGQRRRDIAIRLALGASEGSVVRAVLLEMLRLGGVGVLAGLLLAMLASRALTPFLFGTFSHMPSLYASMVLGIGLMIGIASYYPARAAVRSNPMLSLRSDR
jgi:putative ABC transport system permease protein